MDSATAWDRRYAKAPHAYGTEPNEFLRSVASYVRGRVLCLGAGEGRNANWLAAHGRSVVAVDWSRVGLSRCKCDTVLGDCTDDIVTGQFDAVVVIFCAVLERRKMLRRAMNRLRPGGVLVVELFAPDDHAGPTADRRVDADTLASEVAGVVFCRAASRVVHEGKYHAAKMRRVTQLLARAPPIQPDFKLAMDSLVPKCYPDEDEYLSKCGDLARYSLKWAKDTGRCLYCWASVCRCQPANMDRPWDNITVLCHPLEFLRSTSTGRLAASVQGATFLLWGQHYSIADLVVLYPTDDADVVSPGERVVALDGSWRQTAAMLASLRKTHKNVRCVRLSDETLASYRSSVVLDALHSGAGAGRLATFEAIALAMDDRGALEVLRPFVDGLGRPRKDARPKKKKDREARATALQQVASTLPGEQRRYCPICNVTLGASARMQAHVAGRRHCLAVADSIDTDGDLASLFHQYSTLVIREQPPELIEPPDHALVSLRP